MTSCSPFNIKIKLSVQVKPRSLYIGRAPGPTCFYFSPFKELFPGFLI
jgi:hypothetical protein